MDSARTSHAHRAGSSIRGRVTLLIFACVLPLWIGGCATVYVSFRQRVQITQLGLRDTARALTLAVDRELGVSEAALTALSTSPSLAAEKTDLAAFYRQAAEVARQQGAVTLSLVDESGLQVVNTVLPFDEPPRLRTRHDAVRKVFAEGRTVIADVWTGPKTGIPQYGIDVPVRRQGRVVYDLAISMPSSRMQEVLAAQQLPANSVCGIIDRDGKVVARQPNPQQHVGSSAPQPVLAAIADAPEGLIEFLSFEKVWMTGAFSRSSRANWTVVIAVPTSVFHRQALSELRFTIATSLAVTILALIAGYVFSRRIVQPIQALVPPAMALGEGQRATFPSTGLQEADEVGHALETAFSLLQEREAASRQAERDLREKTELLMQSNADLERFAYAASHDLSTPLRNIVSFAQLLERRYSGQIDDDADDFIRFIIDNGKRMTDLISDLLFYSRIGNCSFPPQSVSSAEAVAQALINLKPEIDCRQADVVVGNLPPVHAEFSLLVSLFQNLLGNALKYCAGDTRPSISVVAERLDSDRWIFAVADNGVGIDKDYHDRIFEIFQRLNPAAETKGTGIGLALCRRIVHQFGGTIWVESEAGKGATFFFSMPVA